MVATERISTPGEILKKEFLDPMGISRYRLAEAIGKPESEISEIVDGSCSITVEMAHLLSHALGTSPEFWMNLESTYQMKASGLPGLP